MTNVQIDFSEGRLFGYAHILKDIDFGDTIAAGNDETFDCAAF